MEHQELEWMDRRFFETEVQVEAPGGFIDGVDEQGSHTGYSRGCFNASQGVVWQRFAESPALLGFIDCQPGQQHDADGVVREPLSDAARALLLKHGSRGERAVPDNTARINDHVGIGGVGLPVGPGKLLQPIVQGRVGAMECAEIVFPAKLFDDEPAFGRGRHDQRLAMCGSLKRWRRRGLSWARRSSAARKDFHCLWSGMKRFWSASACSAFHKRCAG